MKKIIIFTLIFCTSILSLHSQANHLNISDSLFLKNIKHSIKYTVESGYWEFTSVGETERYVFICNSDNKIQHEIIKTKDRFIMNKSFTNFKCKDGKCKRDTTLFSLKNYIYKDGNLSEITSIESNGNISRNSKISYLQNQKTSTIMTKEYSAFGDNIYHSKFVYMDNITIETVSKNDKKYCQIVTTIGKNIKTVKTNVWEENEYKEVSGQILKMNNFGETTYYSKKYHNVPSLWVILNKDIPNDIEYFFDANLK